MPPSDDSQELFVSGPSSASANNPTGDLEPRSKEVQDGMHGNAGLVSASLPHQQATSQEEESECAQKDDDDPQPVDEDVCCADESVSQQESSSKLGTDDVDESMVQSGDEADSPQVSPIPIFDEDKQQGESLAPSEDVIAERRRQQFEAARESTSSADEGAAVDTLKLLRKGAVAAVGGAMVGVGLVMIPLPTPFGAVIASSGLALLGTEFEGAKEMNERVIEGVNIARDHIVKSIESMEQEESDADESPDEDSSTPKIRVTASTDADGSPDLGSTTACSSGEREGEVVEARSEDSGNERATPFRSYMNPVERERQERIARERDQEELQSAYFQTKQYLTRKAGSFLSKNLLPLLKAKEEIAHTPEQTESHDNVLIEGEVLPRPVTTDEVEERENDFIMVPYHEGNDHVATEISGLPTALVDGEYEKRGDDSSVIDASSLPS